MTLTSLVAVALGPVSRHIDKVDDEGYIYELNPSNGLGGVRSYTQKHTFTYTHTRIRAHIHKFNNGQISL